MREVLISIIKHYKKISKENPPYKYIILLITVLGVFVGESLTNSKISLFFEILLTICFVAFLFAIYHDLLKILSVILDFIESKIKSKKESLNIKIENSSEAIKSIRDDEYLAIALDYTKWVFKDYMNQEELDKLCSYIQMYNNRVENFNKIAPIQFNINGDKLYNYDLSNYGYNIWSYIRINRSPLKPSMGNFLKYVFNTQYKEAEETSITKNLGSDMADATIRIDKKLTTFIERQQQNS